MEDIYWLIFLMNELKRKTRYELLKRYNTPKDILKLNKKELRKNGIIVGEDFFSNEKRKIAKEHIKLMKKHRNILYKHI